MLPAGLCTDTGALFACAKQSVLKDIINVVIAKEHTETDISI